MASFSAEVLQLDLAREAERICAALRAQVFGELKRRGAVVGLSGGIDSSVVGALCARALGPARVLGLLMPERESAAETLGLSRALAQHLQIPTEVEEISPVLDGLGCYRRRDAAIRAVAPEYGPGDTAKLVLPPVTEAARYNIFSLVIRSADGRERRLRLTPQAYLGIVAATNFKQRVRTMLAYYHADRLHYAVAGTPNRLEYDQGFFVKAGDGAADFKPIAHLYKSQVYALAEHLGVPESIRSRPPTTDTYPLAQGQDEFFFALPYAELDLCLWGKDHGVAAAAVAPAIGLTPAQVEQVFADIERKRLTTRYLHAEALLVEAVFADGASR